jgi:hypothetical protein
MVVGWDANKEKLRALITLDDRVAQLLSPLAGDAFYRGFVVEDRKTGKVSAKFRYRYREPKEASWYTINLDDEHQGPGAVEYMIDGLTKTLVLGAKFMGIPLPATVVEVHRPPDDGGDWGRTLIWLEMKDLVEITEVKEVKPK